MRAPILAALFPQWRHRDERLCREIVARGICAPTTDLGIAVRATLARVDSLREQRDHAIERWDRANDACQAFEAEAQGACNDSRHLASELCASRAMIKALRAELEGANTGTAIGAMSRKLGEVCDAIGASSPLTAVETAKGLHADAMALRGIHRDMLRVVGERDEARRELAALRESVKDVARRMAEQISEVSNG